jgi:hypothetical protein
MNSIENTPRWWRDPLVHFLALGGVLFALDFARPSDAAGSGSAAGGPIVVSAAHVAELETALQRTGEPTLRIPPNVIAWIAHRDRLDRAT